MTMRMRSKMKNKSQRHNINWPRPRHGPTSSKWKMCLSIMVVICIKQHLSNIWISVYEKVKPHCGWVGKSDPYKRSV